MEDSTSKHGILRGLDDFNRGCGPIWVLVVANDGVKRAGVAPVRQVELWVDLHEHHDHIVLHLRKRSRRSSRVEEGVESLLALFILTPSDKTSSHKNTILEDIPDEDGGLRAVRDEGKK